MPFLSELVIMGDGNEVRLRSSNAFPCQLIEAWTCRLEQTTNFKLAIETTEA